MVLFCFFACITDILTAAASPAYRLSTQEVLNCLLHPAQVSAGTYVIVIKMRLPIALMALVVGFSLGTAGATMQTILHNPLASPYTLGVGTAAGFGASVAIVLGLGSVMTSVLAFVFAMLICLMIYFLGRNNVNSGSLVLSGIACLFLFQALQALLQYGASEDQNQSIVFWSFGSLQRTDWMKLLITTVVVAVTTPLIFTDSWKYTALTMGDDKAVSLGVNVSGLKIKAFFLISLMAAVSVCFTGSIGFIGLAGPHIARMLVGEDQRFYLPISALCGASILSAASIISKLIQPGSVFPVGIVTSIIGVPFFFSLVFRSNRGGGRA
ncbi:MAG: iron ABC transporter permease [Oscillospiraceae bacterium]|nr:iron ABC transporter permease [Oscillospiraceae bacterium]